MRHSKISIVQEVEKLYKSPAFLLLLVFFLFFTAACGKKGGPTLKEYDKPAPPSSLRAIHRENKIVLLWAYPTGKENSVAEFVIFKSSGAEFKKLVHLEKNRRTYEDAEIETGFSYRYKIVTQSFKGVYSDDSNILEASPLNPPLPPSDLSYIVQDNSLLISWKPAEKGNSYNIYKSLVKGSYGLYPVNSSPVSENSFHDSFSINKTVYYSIRSLHGSAIRDEGAPSEELEVDPSELVPSPLKNFRYHASPDGVFLFWDEPEESWVTRFRIYRKTEGQDYLLIGETQIPVFVDREPALTKRDYRIHAVGPAKEGPGIVIMEVIYSAPSE